MFQIFSHILAFSVLFIASVFDLRTTEVPDTVSIIGVVGGITLHAAASLSSGSLFSGPLIWSLGVGTAFSVYGWALYYFGMWGGADAFAMSVLGFAAPYGISGPTVLYPMNLFLNILIAGFFYTLVFAFYRAFKTPSVWKKTLGKIEDEERRISAEIIFSALVSMIGAVSGSFNSFTYFGVFLVLIVLYRFLMTIQEESLTNTVSVDELEGGEVVSAEHSDRKIRGIDSDEIEEMEAEEVEVTEGARFLPVFLLSLVITDFLGGGIGWLYFLIN